jgi:hypothetical protein
MPAPNSNEHATDWLAAPTRRLVVAGVIICEWSLLGGTAPLPEDFARWMVWIAAAGGARLTAGRPCVTHPLLPSGASLASVIAVGAWPLICRSLLIADCPGGTVASWEIALARLLTGAAVTCAALAAWPRLARTAATASVFLVLFAHAFGDTSPPALRILVALYAAAGSSWLMLDYRGRTPALSAARQTRPPWVRRALPSALLAALAIGAGSIDFGFEPRRIGSWFASSGGSERADPTARSGRQDGAAGFRSDQVPDTIGFADTNRYLDTPRPSLYDVINETLGEPTNFVSSGKLKSIRLDEMRTARGNPSVSFEAENRAFSTKRSPLKKSQSYSDRVSSALCLVEGPQPLHLRTTVYDRFDGLTWHDAGGVAASDGCRSMSRGSWMQCPSARFPSGVEVEVTVKVVRLATNRAPTPADPVRFRCGSVDQPEYFAWLDDGVLAMRYQKFLPAGARFDFVSRQVDDESVRTAKFTPRVDRKPQLGGDRSRAGTEKRIDALIRSWVGSTSTGAERIAAVVAGLQSHARLDPTASVPETATDSIEHFLFESRSGPDYLFASTFAVILDRLGYTVRLASGFYADERSYDESSDHHALGPADLHFWAEVRDDAGRWHVVEATPGYSVYRPGRPWTASAREAVTRMVETICRHYIAASFLAAAIRLAWLRRRELRDRAATVRWYLRRGHSSERRVRGCLRIVRNRAAVAGLPQSPGETLITFVHRLALLRGGPAVAELHRLAVWLDGATFGRRPASAPTDSAEFEPICRTVLRAWTLARLRGPRPAARRNVLTTWKESFAKCFPIFHRRPTVSQTPLS